MVDFATYAALTNYDTAEAALAANPNDGDAWLLNDPQIFKDGTMPKAGPASIKRNQQTQKAKTLNPTNSRNKGNDGVVTANVGGEYVDGTERNLTFNTNVGGAKQSSLKDNQHKEVVNNTKGPAIRNMVTWHVTDSSRDIGYRQVNGLLEDESTTDPGRDDDNQVRK